MKKLDQHFAKSFAEKWISAWNSHDINAILDHYSDDFTIESRIAAELVPSSKGKVVGKLAVKEYWTIGLNRNKQLQFKLLDVLLGINGVTIYYVNVTNELRAAEVLVFNDEGKVKYASVHHSK